VLEQTELARAGDGLGARGHAELPEDHARVRADRVEGDIELGGDLPLRETATVALRGLLSPSRRVSTYRIQKLREGHQVIPKGSRRPLPVGGGPRNPEWFREDFVAMLELLREGKIHPVVAERMPLTDARRAHELLESAASKGKLVLVP